MKKLFANIKHLVHNDLRVASLKFAADQAALEARVDFLEGKVKALVGQLAAQSIKDLHD